MKSFAVRIAILSFAASAATFAAAPPPPDSNQIQAQGCVTAVAEASCMVVKDPASGKLYNLFIKGAKPSIGAGIEFTGHPSSGATTCRRGVAIDVSNWQRRTTINCKRSSVD